MFSLLVFIITVIAFMTYIYGDWCDDVRIIEEYDTHHNMTHFILEIKKKFFWYCPEITYGGGSVFYEREKAEKWYKYYKNIIDKKPNIKRKVIKQKGEEC